MVIMIIMPQSLLKFLLPLLVGIFLVAPVHAQDTSNNTSTDKREAARERVQEKKAGLRNARQEKRIEAKERVQAKREETKTKIKERRESLKEKLAEFKDRKKAAVAERIDAKLGEVNKRKTDQMSVLLDKMSSILDRLGTKVTETNDNTETQAAINNARVAVTTAQTAVEIQAGRDYGVTVTDESTVKSNASLTRSQLQTDLKLTHQAVVAARLAVARAIATTKAEK